MHQLRLSIIVPFYNVEKYIAQCLDSLLNQNIPYEEYEILCVDDGSPDNSMDIVRDYAKQYSNVILIQYVENQDVQKERVNKGVSVARNFGIENARGEYVCIVDSDDCLPYNALQVMIDGIGDADMWVGQLEYVADGSFRQFAEISHVEYWNNKTIIQRCIEDNPAIYSSCGKLYKRSVLQDVRFPVGYKYHEDSFFVFCCAQRCQKVVVTDARVYCYRTNPNSVSRGGFKESMYDMIKLAELKYGMVLKNYPEFSPIADNLLLKAYMAYLSNLINAPVKKYLKQCLIFRKKIIEYESSFISSGSSDDWRLRKMTTYFYLYYLLCHVKIITKRLLRK